MARSCSTDVYRDHCEIRGKQSDSKHFGLTYFFVNVAEFAENSARGWSNHNENKYNVNIKSRHYNGSMNEPK